MVKRAEQQRPQRLRPGAEAQRAADRPRLPAPRRARPRRAARVRDGRAPVALGDRPGRRAAVDHRGLEVAQPLSDRGQGDRDATRAGPRRAVRRRLAHHGDPGGWVRYSFAAPNRTRFYTLTSAAEEEMRIRAAWVVEGSRDGRALDGPRPAQRRGVPAGARRPARSSCARRGAYTHYRISLAGAAGARRGRAARARSRRTRRRCGRPRSRWWPRPARPRPSRSKLTNHGAAAASGTLTAAAPSGWTVNPASASFGPLAPGESATIELRVAVPEDVEAGTYAVRLADRLEPGRAPATARRWR